MGMLGCLSPPKLTSLPKFKQAHISTPTSSSKLQKLPPKRSISTAKLPILSHSQHITKSITILIGTGVALIFLVEPTSAVESPIFNEPSNALSLPTWAVHVSSVVEWATAMALVWQYGEKSGYESWKGLSWGMVPLFGGALCACTWHFFYNSESLEVLVALQAALTVIGNATMCIAAYRIYISSQERSNNS